MVFLAPADSYLARKLGPLPQTSKIRQSSSVTCDWKLEWFYIVHLANNGSAINHAFADMIFRIEK